MQTGTATVENSVETAQKPGNRTAARSSNATAGHIFWGNQNWKSNLESFGRWMDKKVVVYRHNGVLLSYKKERIWVCSNEDDEPGAYYTEWSQKEQKNILY